MAARLNPYLTFEGRARTAMEFYQEVFGGRLAIDTFGEYGDPSSPTADLVMHSRLDTDRGFTLMAGDASGGGEYGCGECVSISVSGPAKTDGDELRAYWHKLSANGVVKVPFEKQVWGDEFGMCTDQFGIGWMVNVEADAHPPAEGSAGQRGSCRPPGPADPHLQGGPVCQPERRATA